MNKIYSVSKKGIIIFTVALVISGLLVAIMGFSFVNRLQAAKKKESNNYLTEVSHNSARALNDGIGKKLTIMDSICKSYVQINKDSETAETYLKEKKELYALADLRVVSKDGKAAGADKTVLNLSGLVGFTDALKGKKTVSSTRIAPISGVGDSIYYIVPLYRGNEIDGAMISFSETSAIEEIFSSNSFDDKVFFQIMNLTGDFLIPLATEKQPFKDHTNFFAAIKGHERFTPDNSPAQIKSQMTEGLGGNLYYTLEDGANKILNYTPLGYSDLYLISTVALESVNKEINALAFQAIFVNLFIVGTFFVFACLMLFINYRNNRNFSAITFIDPITGGYSKTRFAIEAEKKICAAPANTYLLAAFDICNFKLINDIFGNENGDRVLRYIYNVMNEHLEPDELLCRESADHFHLLMRDIPREKLLMHIDKITKQINEFNEHLEQPYYLTFAIGIYEINDPKTPIAHIQGRANGARKNTSRSVGNHFYSCVFYNDSERQKMIREKDMENKMSGALENKQFVVYLQPKIELNGNKIVGAEALVRWNDPDKGLVPPNDFIPFFERNGFILKLDLYVFESVCRLLRKWIDEGHEPIPISVNLSRAYLNNPDFLNHFISIQQRYAVPADLLEFEVTETMALENPETLAQIIDQIHQVGFRCSLDDFGSGYSSLNILKDVKVDILKLDRAFFSSVKADDSREQAIIESVVSMAKKLNMQTISEGVETSMQLQFLKNIRCDMVQGYVFSKPIPIETFENILFIQNLI